MLRVLRAGDVFTLIGRQRGDTIVSDATRDGAARLTATKRTLAELIADERAALKPYRWATRALVALVLVVAGGLILAPRRTGDALWAAVRRTISLSLWYAVLAGLAISSLVEGTDLLVAGSGIAGFLAFVWSMAMIPSGPTPLR